MSLKAKKYHGTVGQGSELIQSQSGTLGYQVNLKCEDGEAVYVIWLTPKTKANAEKTFTEALGVPKDKLLNGNYIELQLGLDIAGREVTFVCQEEEYKGKSKIKVAWLFKRSSVGAGSPAKAAALFFGGEPIEISDEDVPF